MKEAQLVIANTHGIHCRPSSLIVKACKGLDCNIRVIGVEGEANCRNMLELISLGLAYEAQITVRCEGVDEDVALAKMVEMFSDTFDLIYRND